MTEESGMPNSDSVTASNGLAELVTNKARTRKAKNRKQKSTASEKRRVRGGQRSFPSFSFQETVVLAEVINRSGVQNRMRRLTIFDELNKSPDSGPSRMLITNSSKYGLTTGGYQADYLELTEQGKLAVDADVDASRQLQARFALAITGIPPFNFLYEKLAGSKLPAQSVIFDLLQEFGIAEDEVRECADMFIVNLKFLGLLKTVAGAERVLKVDHAIEDLPKSEVIHADQLVHRKDSSGVAAKGPDWDHLCFYITPIGAEDSEERRHSDLFLNSLVEPALRDTDLRVIRADQIGKAGMIGAQVIDYVIRARLVIADLSFHNPNVFYELCLRHACGLPTVQIIRAQDSMPFDLQNFRTIPIDNSNIYSLVPKLDVYRSEIATQVRQALANSEAMDNPILTFCPGLKVIIPALRGTQLQQIVM